VVGLWGSFGIVVAPYSTTTKGALLVTVFHDADIALRHPVSFAVMNDALPTTDDAYEV